MAHSRYLRMTWLVAAVLAGGLVPASAATAAFPGVNGKIVFTSEHPNIGSEIFVMNGDGTQPTRLTYNEFFDFTPTFSSNSRRIAFASGRNGDYEIFVMNVNGTGKKQLTFNGVDD